MSAIFILGAMYSLLVNLNADDGSPLKMPAGETINVNVS